MAGKRKSMEEKVVYKATIALIDEGIYSSINAICRKLNWKKVNKGSLRKEDNIARLAAMKLRGVEKK